MAVYISKLIFLKNGFHCANQKIAGRLLMYYKIFRQVRRCTTEYHQSLNICFHFCLKACEVCHTFDFPIYAVVLQDITNESCLVCIKSEKYVFWVTIRPLGSMKRDKSKLLKLQYQVVHSEATYNSTHSSVSSPPSVSPNQLCLLAHLGCTRAAGTSQFIL